MLYRKAVEPQQHLKQILELRKRLLLKRLGFSREISFELGLNRPNSFLGVGCQSG